MSHPAQTMTVSNAQHAGMEKILSHPESLCPDLIHGAAMCAYCSSLIDLDIGIAGGNSEVRRMDILDALSSSSLGLTEKEQFAMGKCLAYFDHFNGADVDGFGNQTLTRPERHLQAT
jgi:hypothetical protein